MRPRATFGIAERTDAETLAAIDAGSPTPWPIAAFVAELSREPPSLFTLRMDGEAVAFSVIRVQPPEMDIVNMAVAPGKRRQGFGRTLMNAVLEYAAAQAVEAVFLEVRAGHSAALGLYRSVGFQETQRRHAFYKNPVEDAVLMRRSIAAAANRD